MEWMLMVGLAVNDPNPAPLVRVATFDECQTAVVRFQLMSSIAAEEHGESKPPDLYLTCSKSKKQGE